MEQDRRSGVSGGCWAAGMRALVVLAGLLLAPLAQAGLLPYATLPGAVASERYTLRVNGQPVLVEKFGDVSLARFAFSGEAAVEVTASQDIASASISPLSYGLTPATSGRLLSFTLRQPRQLILRINDLEKLLILADGPERDAPVLGAPGVVDVRSFLPANRDPQVAVTAQLQQAIDAVAALNGGAGGVLFFPDGLYMSSHLRLRSGVRLHLASGALLRAVPVFTPQNYPVQEQGDSAFLYGDTVDRVSITGRGTVDGNGFALRSNTPGGGNCKLIRFKSSTNLLLRDIHARDSARWSFHFLASDHVLASNIKLVNDLRVTTGTRPFVSNTDGFDIDAAADVTVQNSFIYTTDDAITPKVTSYLEVDKPTENILIRNNVIWTQKSALKVGSEANDSMHHITFDSNDVVFADRLLAVWNGGRWDVHDIVLTHNRTETIGLKDQRSFFSFLIDHNPPGLLRAVRVNGLYAQVPALRPSLLDGYDATHRIEDFSIRNMVIGGLPVRTAADVPVQANNAFADLPTVTPPGQDGPATVQVLASDDYGIEGEDSAAFVISRAGSLSAPLTVNFSLSGTATVGPDVLSPGTSVTLPAGAHQVRVLIEPLADTLNEGTETLTLSLQPGPGYVAGTFASASVEIADGANAPPPRSTVSLEASDALADEAGDTGRVTLRRVGDTSAALPVYFHLGGSAVLGEDYADPGEARVFAAGASTTAVDLQPLADSLFEDAETITVELIDNGSYDLGPATSATVTLADVQPAAVSLVALDASASESGDPGAFALSRAGDLSRPLTLQAALGGSAANGSDYASIDLPLVFAAGVDTLGLTITPLADLQAENEEDVSLTVFDGSAYYVAGARSATVLLADVPPPMEVSLAVSDASASEAGGDIGRFTVSRTGNTATSVVVAFSVGGTATSGSDYASLGSSVTIPAGAVSATVDVSPLADSLTEGSETVTLSLLAGADYQLGPSSSGSVSIADVVPGTVTLAVSDGSASEAPGNGGRWTITRSGAKTAPLDVYFTLSGTALNGADYVALGSPVQIPAGAVSVAVNLTPLADAVTEGNESVVLTLAANPAYALGASIAGTVNIIDVPKPTVTVTLGDAVAGEPADAGSFTLTRTGATTAALSVTFSLGGSASNGVDYTPVAGTVSIPAGASSLTLGILPVADELVEGSETVVLTLQPDPAFAYGIGASASATLNLKDAAPALPTVTVALGDAQAAEPDDAGSFIVSRSGSTGSALTVTYSLSGSAGNGVDYAALGGSVTLPAGATAAPVTVSPLADSLLEGSETVVLTLGANAAYTLGGSSSASLTLADAPPPLPVVSVSASDASASEAAGDSASFVFSRSGTLDAPLTVAYSLSGSAGNGVDYAALGGSVNFAAGVASLLLTVSPLADDLAEGSETVSLSLSPGAAYTLGASSGASIEIADVPPVLPVVSLAVSDASASEASGNPGSYTLTRSGSTAAALTVSYALSGSASNGTDYASLPGTATFAAGASSLLISLNPLADSLTEGSEIAVLSLTPGAAYTLDASSSAGIEILDVPPALPVIALSVSDAAASEAAGNPGSYTLTRSGSTAASLTVSYALSGSASNGTDYASLPGTATFPAGASSLLITLSPLADSLTEGTETVVLSLSPGATYTLDAASSGSVSIADVVGTGPTLTVTVVDGSASEAAGNPGTISVGRSGAKTAPLTVYFALEGSASNGLDYSTLPTSLTIPAGSGSASLTVSPLPDRLVEGSETVTLRLLPDASYVLGTASSGSVSIVDVPPPVITLAVTDASAAESGSNTGVFTLSRSGAKTEALTLRLAVSGTAQNGVDYEALPLTVVIPAAGTSVKLTVAPLLDTLVESAETVTLSVLADEAYALGSTVSGSVSIADVAPVTVTLAVSDAVASESGDTGSVTFSRSGSKTAAFIVDYSLAGSALNGVDYASLPGTVEIPAGAASVTLSLVPLADNLAETAETAVFSLRARSSYLIGTPSSATVNIGNVGP